MSKAECIDLLFEFLKSKLMIIAHPQIFLDRIIFFR